MARPWLGARRWGPAPNTCPAMEWPAGFLGSSPDTEGYQATCASGRSEKGVAEQGTRSLCSPTLPFLPSLSPHAHPCARGHRRPGGGCSNSRARCQGSRTGGWCSVSRAFLPGWSFSASQKGNGVFPPGKKNAGPAGRYRGDPGVWQRRYPDEGPACLQKHAGSYEEAGGQPHRSAAG